VDEYTEAEQAWSRRRANVLTMLDSLLEEAVQWVLTAEASKYAMAALVRLASSVEAPLDQCR
jgi:hypothetical protein